MSHSINRKDSKSTGEQSDRNWLSRVTDVIGVAVGISVGIVAQATDIIGGIANEVKSAVFKAMNEGSSNSRKRIANAPANNDVHEIQEVIVEKAKPTDAATISTSHTSVQDLEDFDAKYTSSCDVKSSESKKEDYDEFLRFLQQ